MSPNSIDGWAFAKAELERNQKENEEIWTLKLHSMEEKLEQEKLCSQKLLSEQRQSYESQLKLLQESISATHQLYNQANLVPATAQKSPLDPPGGPDLACSDSSLDVARRLLAHMTILKWKRYRFMSLVATLLECSVLVKEANCISRELSKHLLFQFTIHFPGTPHPSLISSRSPFALFHETSELYPPDSPAVAVEVLQEKPRLRRIW
eukprot:Sdes_comp23547_c0_seq1m21762